MANTVIARLEFPDKTIHFVLESVVFLVHDKESNSVTLSMGIDGNNLKSNNFEGDDCQKVMELFDDVANHSGYQVPGLKPIPDFICFDSDKYTTILNMAYVAAIIDIDDNLSVHFTLEIEPFTIKKSDKIMAYLEARTIT